MKHYFVLFQKTIEEKGNAFSLVNEAILKNIPKKIIKAKKEVPNKIYSKDELRVFVEELGGIWYAS